MKTKLLTLAALCVLAQGCMTIVTAPVNIGCSFLDSVSDPVSPGWTNGVAASPKQWEQIKSNKQEEE